MKTPIGNFGFNHYTSIFAADLIQTRNKNVTKNNNLQHLFILNLTMLLMSTSGPLGRSVTMAPPLAIWWRCLLAAVFLYLFCKWWKINLRISWSADGGEILLGGILLGLHWVTYFYALQLSNVAVGMLSLFTYPVFTALLEPLLLKTRFHLSHLALAILVMVGIYLLAPDLNLDNTHTRGIAFGILSSLLYALRNILLKKKINNYHGSALMLYQLAIVVFLLTPAIFIFDSSSFASEWPALLTLGLVTTAMGHTLFAMSFKHFSVSTASIISSTQPIYGIIIGIFFLHEFPEWNTIVGGILILTTVVIESARSYNASAEKKNARLKTGSLSAKEV